MAKGKLSRYYANSGYRAPPCLNSLPAASGALSQVTVYTSATRGNFMEFESIEGAGAPQIAPTQEVYNSLPRTEAALSMEQNNLDQSAGEASLNSGNVEAVQPQTASVNKRERMSGAARKRFKYLLTKGLTKEEARKRCFEPIKKGTTDDKGLKRAQSEGSAPQQPQKRANSAPQQPQKRANEGTIPEKRLPVSPKPTFSQVAEGKKVGIVPTDFPDNLLTVQQMQATQEAIMDKIVDLDSGDATRPQFLSSHYRPGWLTLACANEATVKWLKDAIDDIKPWEGASLKVVEDNEVPHAQILVGYLPGSQDYDNEKILKLLERQNEGLNTKNWRVLKRAEEGTAVLLTLSVDHQSGEQLKEKGYKVSYKFGHVHLRPKSNNPKKTFAKPEGSRDQRPSTSGGFKWNPVTKRQVPKQTGSGYYRATSEVMGRPQQMAGSFRKPQPSTSGPTRHSVPNRQIPTEGQWRPQKGLRPNWKASRNVWSQERRN